MSIKKFGQDGEYHQMFNQKKIFIPPKFYFSPQKKICHFGLYQKRIFFPPAEKKSIDSAPEFGIRSQFVSKKLSE